jgi:hypothetical protein
MTQRVIQIMWPHVARMWDTQIAYGILARKSFGKWLIGRLMGEKY